MNHNKYIWLLENKPNNMLLTTDPNRLIRVRTHESRRRSVSHDSQGWTQAITNVVIVFN